MGTLHRSAMRSIAILVALAALSVAFVAPAQAEGTVRLAVFGDTGTNSNTRSNVAGAVADGATTYLGLGDYEYWDSVTNWNAIFSPFGTKHLARGNHDSLAHFAAGTSWSRSVNGARIVAIDTEQRMDVGTTQYQMVRYQLCNAAESVRILVMHKAWWLGSGARHPGAEFPGSATAMDQLVQDCKVSLVMAGHEHNYQRMVRNGAHYLIVGTGGQSMYAVSGAPSGTVATYYGYGRILLDVSASGWSAQFRSISGNLKDSFASGATGGTTGGTTSGGTGGATSGAVAFAPSGGNEWWAQVKTTGATVTKVEAKDENSAWTALTFRSWGAWAGSLHVEPGNTVTYRATLADGTTQTSCAYQHPTGGCAAPVVVTDPVLPTVGGSVTFSSNSGNEWWAQVKTSGATVTKVEAKDENSAWTALTFRSWGAWAGSLHVEPGNTVTYRATLADGTTQTSCAYQHPTSSCASAPAPVPGPAPATSAVSFVNVRGNVWWVETGTTGATPTTVEARVNGGAWVALPKTSWGSWARSMSAPTGSSVELRATLADGSTALSAKYAWPPS